MANKKRLVYVEDIIALFEKDIAESKDALKTAFYGDKEEIRAEMNGVKAALCILKHHASHGGTVDAVEVVRCKDCKHSEPSINAIGEPCCCCNNADIGFYEWLLGEDDFCSYGERKDDEN